MAGHDIDYAAITGALHLVGGADRPVVPVNVLADFGGGTLYLLVGVLAALQSRAPAPDVARSSTPPWSTARPPS